MVPITISLEDDYVIKLDRLQNRSCLSRERIAAVVIKEFLDKVEQYIETRRREAWGLNDHPL